MQSSFLPLIFRSTAETTTSLIPVAIIPLGPLIADHLEISLVPAWPHALTPALAPAEIILSYLRISALISCLHNSSYQSLCHHPVVYCRVPWLPSTPGFQRSSPTHPVEPWPRGVYLDVITPIIVLPTPPIIQQTERAPFPPSDVYVTGLQTLRARAPPTQSTHARHVPLLSPMCVFTTPLSIRA